MSDRKARKASMSKKAAEAEPQPKAPPEARDGFRNLFENLPIGVAITTMDGIAIDANPAMVRMFGYDSKEEALGRPAVSHYLDPADRERFLQAREEGMVRDFEVQLKRKDGSPIWVSMSAAGQTGEGGSPQILTTFRDITERHEAREAIESSEARLREAQEIAHVGHWHLDITENQFEWSDEAGRIFGVGLDYPNPSMETFLEFVHPVRFRSQTT